jgi:biopolymer transport protein TolQ
MLTLLCASIYSWALIIKLNKRYKFTSSINEHFSGQFNTAKDWQRLYKMASVERVGVQSMFLAGYSALSVNDNIQTSVIKEQAESAISIAYNSEVSRLEKEVWILGVIGSISPYIGLLGTVVGVMHSMSYLSNINSASLTEIAPGIAEALIATAIGLFAAIPASIGFNRFNAKLKAHASFCQNFAHNFMSKTNLLLEKN